MEKVEYYFREISKIPRGSYNEKAICDYVENFAKERNIKYVRDKMHNIVLFKEATKGYEDHETVMLEGHMDMVCEKNNDSDHDFSKDPIELIEEDGFLHANKTTLGADDGVGVCYMLALLDDESLKHPALECVFTVQEEVGLNGAMGLDKSILKAKKMIGLDRGKEKIITVSCSGGRRAVVEKELSYLKNESPCYQLYVGGLQGGHSGGVIHLERGNANVIMTRVYYHLSLNNIEFLLGSFKGGLKDNAIPRECVSVFASNDDFKKIKEVVLKVENDLKEELKESDEHVFVRLEKVDSLNEVISVKESQDIISMMYLMPNGFMHKSLKMDLTNISLNMGVVEMNEKFNIYFSFMYNVDKKPTFVVTNNSQKGQFINRIILYSGKWSRKSFCVIEMLDIQDDLLADNIEFFVAPNSYCKISANATRMVKYITHCDVYFSKRKKVYITLDFGDKLSKRYCTQIRTYEFLQMLISETEAYQDLNIDTLF